MGKRKAEVPPDGNDAKSNPRASKAQRAESTSLESTVSGNGWNHFSGMILRVKLKNFMCHGELDYCPTGRLNFLHGANGSGKSAVLTAIVFGLGGSARTSNRGSSNKGLIMSGQLSTTVEITLYNEGDDAYLPEVYGGSITVVRTVNASGGGSYKLKDHQGRIVCERKVREELGRILEAFTIQVDNPIAILNQDAAKTFLFKCDPDKLYEFFMRATQLEDCKANYNLAAEEKSMAEELMREKAASLSGVKAEKDKWQKKFKFHQTLDDQKVMLQDLKKELAWILSKQAEQAYSEKCRATKVLREKIASLEGRAARQEEIQSTFGAEKTKAEEKIQSLAAECEEHEEEVRGHKEVYRMAKDSRRDLEKEMPEADRKLKSKKAELKAVEDAIVSVRATDEGEVQQRIEKRNERIAEMERMRGVAEAKLASTTNHVNNLAYSVSEYQNKESELRARAGKVNGDIKAKATEVNNMNDSDNALVLFGPNMPKLVEEIERNSSSFKVKPIGPIGAHVKLRKDVNEVQARLIEHEIKSILRAFLVDNFDDKRLLDQLASRCKVNASIITTKFASKVYDVEEGRCCSQFSTIFDCLDVSDPNVMNCLIDQKKIERIILVKDDASAQRMLKSSNTVPKNCLYALTEGFNQYYPAPSYRSYAVMANRSGRPILSASVGEIIEGLVQEIKDLELTLVSLKEQMREVNAEIERNASERSRDEQICRHLRGEVSSLGVELNELKAEAEADKSPDITALEEDKERIEEDVEKAERVVIKLGTKIAEAKAEEKRLIKLYEMKLKQLQEVSSKGDPMKEELNRLEEDYANSKSAKTQILRKADEFKNRLGEFHAAEAKRKEKFEKQLERAKAFSDEPPFESENKMRKPDVAYRELQVMEESIKRQEKSNEPKEVVMQKYKELSVFFAEISQHLDSLKGTISYLDGQLRRRKRGFLDMRGAISRSAAMHFQCRLGTRNYYGNLCFDHKEHLLRIMVNPNSDVNSPEAVRDIKTLSGGEKSYCTVSLVLSLWEDMHPPFRILDEFDVFMDSLNRRIAIDLIVNYAKSSRKYQYLFLTPLNLDHLKGEKEDVQVVVFEKNQG